MANGRRVLPLLGWTAALMLCLWALLRLAAGPLAAPSIDPAGWPAWFATREPLVAVMAVLRLVALGCCAYLALTASIAVLARLAGAVRVARLVESWTVPALRHALRAAVGVSLASAVVIAPLPAGPSGPLAPRAAAATEPDQQLPPVLELLRHGGAADDADPAGDGDDPGGQRPLVPVEREVAAGDSLWHIAEGSLRDAWDRQPAVAEIVAYWRSLIDVNRDRLLDPDDPDLIVPGQRLALPDVPTPSARS